MVGVTLAAEAPAKPTSVVLVTLDTTRADHLGCYGYEPATTPHLDRLATGGVRFDMALSPAPLTVPAHASLMTARVPRRHGARDNGMYPLPGGVPVLAESLRAAGYATAAAVSSYVLDRRAGLARGFDHYQDTVRVGPREAFNHEERAASQTTDVALDMLEGLEPPFFLWVHYFDPHLPYVPPEPFASRHRGRPYDGEIAFMDDQVGRLLAAVRDRTARPLVVVAGDHGEGLGDHGEAAHGVFLYQSTQRVPLIVAGPGVPTGTTVAAPVGLVDIAPTVLDLLGQDPIAGSDGRSLVPAWKDAATFVAGPVEMETLYPRLAYGWAPLSALVESGRKYIEAPRPELYDLVADPGEVRNLWKDRPAESRAMSAALRDRTAGDTVPAPDDDPALAERRMRLESLGYVGGSATGVDGDALVDPKDGIRWIADLDAGRRALQLGRPSDGIAPLERLLARNPDNVQALLALATCRLATSDAARAIALVETAATLRPDDDLVRLRLADAHAVASAGPGGEDSAAEADRNYLAALERNPRRAETWLNYASFLVRQGRPTDALSALRRARGLDVRGPGLAIELGVMELRAGNIDGAVEAFTEAVALDPGDADAHMALARIAEKRSRWSDAAAHYDDLMALHPTADVAERLAVIRSEHLGDPEGAIAAYTRALNVAHPSDPRRTLWRRKISELENARSDP